MRLLVLFKKVLPWEWTHIDARDGDYQAEFMTSNKQRVSVLVQGHTAPEGTVYEFSFDTDTSLTDPDKESITGKGEQYEIFSTVGEIYDSFREYEPSVTVSMSAAESNRASLYNRMLSKLVKQPPYKVERRGNDFRITYVGNN